jgi:acetyl esterase/lipase
LPDNDFNSLVGWLGRTISERSVIVEPGFRYGPGRRDLIDLYRPRTGAGHGPVAIYLYGGGWKAGDRALYGFMGAALASRGITTAIPDYRLYPEVSFPSFVEDAARAYAFVAGSIARSETGAEPKTPARPIYLIGHSAGAHIAALLALDKRYINATGAHVPRPAGLIGLAGPYAFDPTTWPSTKEIFASATSASHARPVTFAGPHAPPTLLMHGTDDDLVKLWNMRELATALRAANVPVRALELSGLGHIGVMLAVLRPMRWRGPVLDEIVRFVTTGSLAR